MVLLRAVNKQLITPIYKIVVPEISRIQSKSNSKQSAQELLANFEQYKMLKGMEV